MSENDDHVRNPDRIHDLCRQAAMPDFVASALVADGANLATTRRRIDTVQQIRAMAEITGRSRLPPGLADQFIASGASVETARHGIMKALAAQSDAVEINGFRGTGNGSMQAEASMRSNMVQQLAAQGLKPTGRD